MDPITLIRQRFPYLSEQDVMSVARIAVMRTVAVGEHFIRSGTVNYNAALVIKGLLRNYHVLPDNSERTVLFTSEGGSVASYASVLSNMPSIEQVTAIEDTLLILMDMREVRKVIEGNDALMRGYTEVLEKMLLAAIDRIDQFVLRSPEERYLRFVKERPDLEQRIPQKYLASYLGITPVSLSRIRGRAVRRI